MVDRRRATKSYRVAEGEWRQVDLHLHTPASADWLEPGTTYLQWLQKADTRGLDIVAITDHNTVEGVARLRGEIERLTWLEANDRLRPQEKRDLDEYRRLGDKILVLPGFEFTATLGFHVLAIFPPATPLRMLELLLLRLNVPVDRLTDGSTEVGATTDVLTAYRLIAEAGGLVIAAHANATHGVAMRGLSFGGQTKIAYTQDPHLHALEVTDLEAIGRRNTAHFFDGSKPEYPRRMHCIQGSDAHRLVRDPKDKNRMGIGDRVTEILLPEVSFEALSAALQGDDFTLTRPYRPLADKPFDHIEAAREEGNTIVQAFHESMTIEGGRMNKVLTDVVALANTRGGTVYVGASAAKKGAPRGVENPQEAVMLLKREMDRAITPRLECHVDVLHSQGIPVVRVNVPNGLDKPYAFRQTRIYVRQEADTNEAVRDEIVRLVLTPRDAQAPANVVQAPEVSEQVVDAAAHKPAQAPASPEPATDAGAAKAKPATAARSGSRRGRRRGGQGKPATPTTPESKLETVQPEGELVVAEAKAVAETVVASASETPAEIELPKPVEAITPEASTAPEPSRADSTEPAPVQPPARRRSRPRRKAADSAASVTQPPVAAETPTQSATGVISAPMEVSPAEPPLSTAEVDLVELPNILEAPAIGVEIVSDSNRDGTRYFTVRDLRNCSTVRDVTTDSARKLWSYAINQYLTKPVDPVRITWSGDFGLWQVGKRARKWRYDLVKRQPDGSLRVFYGVTADGMSGPWQRFLKEEDREE